MSKKELNAITLADDLVDFLGNHPSYLASIHSVYPHAVNFLIREDALITITSKDDITPMGLTVDCGLSFVEFIRAGEEVVLDLDRFTAANGNFTLNLQDASIWQTWSKPNLALRPAEDIAQIRLKLSRWLAQQPAEGLLPLLPCLTRLSMSSKLVTDNIYSRYIAEDLGAFTRAINAYDWERALSLTDRLIGFGMGSTPSCDDFLAAYLVVFNIADALNQGQYAWIREFNQTIASKAKSRTTLISANMLRHAADGKISRSHQRLIQICLFNNPYDLEQTASRVIQHGATSGGDFLLGLICALEWVQNNMMDIHTKMKGESARVDLEQPQPVPGI